MLGKVGPWNTCGELAAGGCALVQGAAEAILVVTVFDVGTGGGECFVEGEVENAGRTHHKRRVDMEPSSRVPNNPARGYFLFADVEGTYIALMIGQMVGNGLVYNSFIEPVWSFMSRLDKVLDIMYNSRFTSP